MIATDKTNRNYGTVSTQSQPLVYFLGILLCTLVIVLLYVHSDFTEEVERLKLELSVVSQSRSEEQLEKETLLSNVRSDLSTAKDRQNVLELQAKNLEDQLREKINTISNLKKDKNELLLEVDNLSQDLTTKNSILNDSSYKLQISNEQLSMQMGISRKLSQTLEECKKENKGYLSKIEKKSQLLENTTIEYQNLKSRADAEIMSLRKKESSLSHDLLTSNQKSEKLLTNIEKISQESQKTQDELNLSKNNLIQLGKELALYKSKCSQKSKLMKANPQRMLKGLA
eukprot:TRINITY_DN10907_c0_g1_i1.p1 TRINITY_DN10907_c0_g1~~TRINITY_DN10907_c0_g1_i1.p1  ORF type:complete len:285 (-),score=67.18 TRINITY_DN10907_c0_g1_i1:65-919(-)